MPAAGWLVAVAMLGVDVGWQPLSEGGVEYIIQLEPYSLQSLREGQAFVSDVPRTLDVRTFRIVVGEQDLPREAPPPAESPASDAVIDGPQLADAPTLDEADVVIDAAALQERVLVAMPPSAVPPVAREAAYPRAENAPEAENVLEEVTLSTAAEAATLAPLRFDWRAVANWLPAIALALFLSVGANLFLAWITWSERTRYRSLLRSLRSGPQ